MSAMVCQNCGQNPATLHYTEIDDDQERTEVHVCEECAVAQGISTETSLPAMLAGLGKAALASATADDLTCASCGMTFQEFRRKGRLGCPKDYEVFAEVLRPLLQKMHGGGSEHRGRLPVGMAEASSAIADRLLLLRRLQNEAVEAERYEEAGRLRDEITALEGAPRTATPGPRVGDV